MGRAIAASVAALIALAPLCIPPAQARADDPCAGITDPTAYQDCINRSSADDTMHGPRMGNCEASPDYGQLGQICRDAWVRNSPPAGELGTLYAKSADEHQPDALST
ncbi:hypothetical protein [Mycobacterium paraffinicum]|uniref:Secreted protein n=1 Tax=Mycobacterium paraffinicum TaxID=53378 RepID=A0ABP8F103_9MYCO|nr:hypothetical protein [Mycobacterium paraffinicum]MCV7312208.1 hypothetical protein [Mycobacterium paraffinicum]